MRVSSRLAPVINVYFMRVKKVTENAHGQKESAHVKDVELCMIKLCCNTPPKDTPVTSQKGGLHRLLKSNVESVAVC